jgi:hypothetical protein
MPYLVSITLFVGLDEAQRPIVRYENVHLDVLPGAYEYELDQIQRALEKRFPGLSFEIDLYVADWAGGPAEAV